MPFRLQRSISGLCSLFACFGLAACDAGSSSTDDVDASCPAPACGDTARVGETCANYARIQLGPYTILNNTWGASDTQIAGQQCIWQTCQPSPNIAWGTSYDWLNGPTGQVESYTAALLGWHFSDVDPASGLPVRVGDDRNVTCTWSYGLQNEPGASQNVAYDLWLAPTSTPTSSTRPSDEIMIWLSKSGGAAPIGSPVVTSVELGGNQWALYEGKGGGWDVHSFVLLYDRHCATLNLNEFLQYLVQNRGFDPEKYLIGIEAGTEVFSARGVMQVDNYGCSID